MTENRVKHIVILNQAINFPYGMASSSRIKLLAKGLADEGCDVTVMIMKGTEKPGQNIKNTEVKGIHENVNFEYMSGTQLRSNKFLLRRYYEFKGFINTLVSFIRLRKQKKLDAVIFYTRNLRVISFFSLLCRCLHVPTILELCEWPLDQAVAHKKNIKSATRFCNNVFRKVDAVIPISSFIADRVKDFNIKNDKNLEILTIPILTDSTQFFDNNSVQKINVEQKDEELPYFLYCGSLNYYEIMDIIIELGVEIKKRKITCKIKILGGNSSDNDKKKLKKILDDKDIGNIIEVLSYLDNDSFKKIQQGAAGLLAPLPDNPQSYSRFPTKIGEYLASSRPLIVNAIGEAKKYLEDKKTAFMPQECSGVSICDKVEEILEDRERADKVGLAGLEVAWSEFRYSVHNSRFSNFIDIVCEKNYRKCKDKS